MRNPKWARRAVPRGRTRSSRPEADALARELAVATGEDIDAAVVRAIEERPARTPHRRAADEEAAIETEPAGSRRGPFPAKRGRWRDVVRTG